MRAGRPTLVVHAVLGADPQSRVGFVVSKAVGGAVVRNRVKRRLRHLVATELSRTPSGPGESARDYVVRALPAAGTTPDRLADDLASAWGQVLRRTAPGRTRVCP